MLTKWFNTSRLLFLLILFELIWGLIAYLTLTTYYELTGQFLMFGVIMNVLTVLPFFGVLKKLKKHQNGNLADEDSIDLWDNVTLGYFIICNTCMILFLFNVMGIINLGAIVNTLLRR